MPQIINTNIASLNAQRNLNKSQSANQTALQRLSSGLRINSAKDDAAGLAISTRFNSQIRGLNVAVRNAGDGISLAQTAEGALGSMNDNLQRVRELAVQSANATNSDVDREALQAEVAQLIAEVSRTADETDFNGRKLLDGSFSATFQIGANAGQTLEISIEELTAGKLGASSESGLSALGNENALANGDLIINGVSIVPSNASDDNSSTNGNDASSIAKVAAINKASDETGVTATVNENTLSGSAMTANALSSGVINLNGFDITLSTTSDAGSTRASVIDSINAISDQTGITAVDSEEDINGISLVAKDGRNISIAFDNASGGFAGLTASDVAAATGLRISDETATGGGNGTIASASGPNVYEGGFTLIADGDVSEIIIKGGDGTGNGDIANSGLTVGTYARGEALMVSDKISETSGATITGIDLQGFGKGIEISSTANGSTSALSLGVTSFYGDTDGSLNLEVLNITVDGVTRTIGSAAGNSVVATGSNSSGTTTAFGAKSVAAALDGFTGVSASAETVIKLDTFTITSNGGTFSIAKGSANSAALLQTISLNALTTSATNTDRLQAAADSINATGSTSGLTAYVTASGAAGTTAALYIVDVDGDNIALQAAVNTAATSAFSFAVGVKASETSSTFNAIGTMTGASSSSVGFAAAGTSGEVMVATGYLKDVNVVNGDVNSISMSSSYGVSTQATYAFRNVDSAGVATFAQETRMMASTGMTHNVLTTAGAAAKLASGGHSAISSQTASVTVSTLGLADGDLVLNGISVKAADASLDKASSIQASDGGEIVTSKKEQSGIAIAAAINSVSDGTSVTATANETVVVGGDGSSAASSNYASGESGRIYINGVDVGALTLSDDGSGSVDQNASRQSAIALINQKTGQTGVTAEDNGKSITLRAEDGRNISVAIDNDDANNETGTGVGFGALIGLDAAEDGIGEADIGTATSSNAVGALGTQTEGSTYETTYSTVTLSSAKAIDISAGTQGVDKLEEIGFRAGSFGGGESGQFLTEIDISTFEGATEALTAIDNAIGAIASQRANLGAIQNRMESTVSNLAITSENLSAANSRIQDADFAKETAELSRTQVLQQAGISILAQANQGPQQVLSLLG
jgi:flagellin